jgi:acyl-CoA synthetase (AMP-forming)/AMP-acid ligase II
MSRMEMDTMQGFRSIADIPPFHGRRRGEKIAVMTDEGEAISYASLDDRCRRFAGFLRSRLVVPGERVAILLRNVPEFVIAYFGTISAGCVAVPVNYRLSASEVAYILSDCSASVVVTNEERFGQVAVQDGARGVRDWLLVDGRGEGGIPFREALAADPVPAPVPAAPGDVAVLLYTSGTTGFPKGAMISHRNTLFNVGSCLATLGYREEDVGLLTLPLFHVTGLHSQLVALLACGATVVLQREYDTKQVLESIARHRVTALFLVPAIYKLLTLREDVRRYDLSSVRIAAYGGAPMAPETILAIRKILPARLHNCYGLTECSSLGTVLPADLALARSDSVGIPVPGTRAEVRGASGETLPPGEPGELYLYGPHIVQGYFGSPKKTREAILDGWLRTGDIARIDSDGLVTILDRAKDMINRGGEKVYGLEVENVLYSYPGVAEAAVFGMSHPVFGEVPAACVVALPGAVVDPDSLVKFCRGRLADYKVPVFVRVVDRLPRNPAGKVLKKELRAQWENRSREETR